MEELQERVESLMLSVAELLEPSTSSSGGGEASFSTRRSNTSAAHDQLIAKMDGLEFELQAAIEHLKHEQLRRAAEQGGAGANGQTAGPEAAALKELLPAEQRVRPLLQAAGRLRAQMLLAGQAS